MNAKDKQLILKAIEKISEVDMESQYCCHALAGAEGCNIFSFTELVIRFLRFYEVPPGEPLFGTPFSRQNQNIRRTALALFLVAEGDV